MPQRDPRLDVFRGLAMFIILVAHLPGNPWNDFIPARFGPSDATEMFVFCSGCASALAFGVTFRRAGFRVGSLRVLHRCWQIYWSHLALFLAVTALCIAGTAWSGGKDYVHALWLQPFFADPRQGLLGLVTLTYVPNYFDILPMYLVVLAMMPVVVAAARQHRAVALLLCLALYLAQWHWQLDLPAEWWSDRPWFFDPFGWQLLFFTGFAFAAGWLPVPPLCRRWLVGLSLALVLVLVPLSWRPVWSSVGWLEQLNLGLAPWADKTHFGALRYLHFLALAYLALSLVDRWPVLVTAAAARVVAGVGQQALPVFLWSMFFAQLLGMALDRLGRDPLTMLAANSLGFLSLVTVAHLARLMRSQPWHHRRTVPGAAPPTAAVTVVPGRHDVPRWAMAGMSAELGTSG
jgi:hypothetical protein